MVAEIRDGDAADLHPVAEGPPDVGDLASQHRCRAGLHDTAVGHVEERHLSRQLIHLDGEVRRLHESAEGLRKWRVLRRPVDVEMHVASQRRPKERQALHVVEVEVGHKGAQRQAGAAVLGRDRNRGGGVGGGVGVVRRGAGTHRLARKEAL